jgi:hypothetical protein
MSNRDTGRLRGSFTKVSPLGVIDGTKQKTAPRPSRRGLMRAIYETVEALGGATPQQILKYLPAAIDDITGIIKGNKLKRAIYSSVYDGYLIHNKENDHYYIAPIDYYEQRQKWLKECQKRSRKGVKKVRHRESYDSHTPVIIPFAYKLLIALLCGVSFCAGILVGFGLGGGS